MLSRSLTSTPVPEGFQDDSSDDESHSARIHTPRTPLEIRQFRSAKMSRRSGGSNFLSPSGEEDLEDVSLTPFGARGARPDKPSLSALSAPSSPSDDFVAPSASHRVCAYSALDPYLEATSSSGLAFSKTARSLREGGDLQYRCPLTIYSAVALAPLGLSPDATADGPKAALYMAPVLFGGVGAAVCQAGMVYYIFQLNKDAKVYYDGLSLSNYCEAEGTDHVLRIICLLILVCNCACDLKESFLLLRYMQLIPDMNPKSVESLNALQTSLATKNVLVTNSSGVEYRIECIAFGGFSSLASRYHAYFWVAVKALMEVGLFVSGTGFVLYANSNENLILKNVALTFITQIDDVLYKFAITDAFKQIMDNLPTIGKVSGCTDPRHKADQSSITFQMLGTYGFFIALFVMSAIMWDLHCTKNAFV